GSWGLGAKGQGPGAGGRGPGARGQRRSRTEVLRRMFGLEYGVVIRFRMDPLARPRRPAPPDGGVGLDRPRDAPGLHRFSHEAMATYFEIYAAHRDRPYAAQAAQAAFDLVDRLERDLSRFLPNSDIARINHLAPGAATPVSPSTLECLL